MSRLPPRMEMAIVTATVLASFAVGAWIDAQTGVPFMLGGMECETVNGLRSCWGYPPTGVAALALAASAVVMGVYQHAGRYLNQLF